MSVDHAPVAIRSLAENGATVVQGRLLSTEPAVYNTEDGKKPLNARLHDTIFTPAHIMVDRTFAGVVKPGELVTWVEGGTIGCYTLNVDAPGPIFPFSPYVFLLGNPIDADGKILENRWRVVLAWPILSDGTVATSEGTMSLDAFAAEVNAAASSTATASSMP